MLHVIEIIQQVGNIHGGNLPERGPDTANVEPPSAVCYLWVADPQVTVVVK